MAKSMLLEKGLPKTFWPEAVNTAVYLMNRCPTKAVWKKTPFEAWSGRTPSVNHLVNEKLRKEDGGRLVDASMYRSLVGSLFYLTATRPDLMFATSLLSRFMSKPSHLHLVAAKRVLRYVMGTMKHGIRFEKSFKLKIKGYCDSDWVGSVDDMKSTYGYVFSLGSGVISWCSKKQDTVAQYSTEAEYMAAGLATQQSLWLRRILEDIGEKQEESLLLHCDNKSAIAMAKNPVFHSRTRHINIKHHFI
ncbi:secreted RxLR effector protein 161-like [Vicia villosa]|uniref:secreted RxLR effector protein 161-like n=1 Tax=Vicia villosa TaxID=3911 RepID=UPI00273C8313|nr:secreted RxLR effector protein 161-like [Vicia villosa]